MLVQDLLHLPTCEASNKLLKIDGLGVALAIMNSSFDPKRGHKLRVSVPLPIVQKFPTQITLETVLCYSCI